jgi:hypothetical protein
VNGGAFQDIITLAEALSAVVIEAGSFRAERVQIRLTAARPGRVFPEEQPRHNLYRYRGQPAGIGQMDRPIKLKFLVGSDCSIAGTTTPGARVDTIVLTTGTTCTPIGGTVRSRADFDGDGRTDLSVFRPSEGNWYLNQSTAGFGVIKWGVAGDTLVPGDYDGDNKTDTAVFRPNADSSQPDYFILRSNGFTVAGVSWGISGDIPVIGDYDADSKTDVTVYRPSSNTFFTLKSWSGERRSHHTVSRATFL